MFVIEAVRGNAGLGVWEGHDEEKTKALTGFFFSSVGTNSWTFSENTNKMKYVEKIKDVNCSYHQI